MGPTSLRDDVKLQYLELTDFLRKLQEPLHVDKLHKVVEWLKEYGPKSLQEEERVELFDLLLRASGLTREALEELVRGSPTVPPLSLPTSSFSKLIPSTGWFAEYLAYVDNSEPPPTFHFFCAATALAASLGRRVWVEKGYYRVYPGMAVVLVAPTGKVRKTSAANVAVSILREAGTCAVLADKVTPEALVEGLNLGQGLDSVGLVYAPEFAVFLGKQKYNEGMVPLLTSLFDSPDRWSSTTIMRGTSELHNICLSLLGCSTPDWLVSAIPRDAFGGGFMSRMLFIVEESPAKYIALPTLPPRGARQRLVEGLQVATQFSGEVLFEGDAREWYVKWYLRHRQTSPINDKFAGYHERKPDHLLRLAMVVEASYFPRPPIRLRIETLERAERLLTAIEYNLPQTFERIESSPVGVEAEAVLNALKRLGGEAPHSLLLRRMSNKLNARTFSEHIRTLRESGMIRETRDPLTGHVYRIVEVKRGD